LENTRADQSLVPENNATMPLLVVRASQR